jgi:phosphate transport system substrate-binding protein
MKRFCKRILAPYSLPAVVTCLTIFILYVSTSPAAQHLVIAGTGDSQSILRILADQFMQKNPQYQVEIPDSIGSGGGIKGLLGNRFEVARTARPLKEKEQNGSLIEYPFALSPVVMATHQSVANVDNLSSAQVLGIYAGTLTQWSQVGGLAEPIFPVDREAGDSSRTILEEHMPGFKATESVAKIFYSTPETVEAISDHQNTIGFMPMVVALTHGLKILSIDGVAPNADSIGKKQYPYFNTFYLISRNEISEAAKAFIDFIYQDEAIRTIRENGLIPIKNENL